MTEPGTIGKGEILYFSPLNKVIKVTIVNGQGQVTFKTKKSARYIFDQSDAGQKFTLKTPITLDALET